MNDSHSHYIGDQVERAIEIIGEESDEYDVWELVNKYVEGELDYQVYLEGENYIRVEIEE